MSETKRFYTFDQFKRIYSKKNINKLPEEPKVNYNAWNLFAIFFALIMINVLSAGHTIPVIQYFYDQGWPSALGAFIGFAGFIGVEFHLFLMMTKEDRTAVVKWFIVGLFITAMGFNIYGTLESISHLENPWSRNFLTAIGFVAGAFVPLANLALGEIFHKDQLNLKQQREAARKSYKNQLAEFEQQVISQYRRYGSSRNIPKDVIDQSILGDDFNLETFEQEAAQEAVEPVKVEAVVTEKNTPKKETKKKKKTTSRVGQDEVKEFLNENPDFMNKTLAEIAEGMERKYNGSPSAPTISKAKKALLETA